MEKRSLSNPSAPVMTSKLRIVDLAGSEKFFIPKQTPVHEREARINELTSINSSLSVLGQCISALADPKRTHIPFRSSKLTKLLKDSLDGQSKIAIIVCVSPSIDCYKETHSTLQFAERAKKIAYANKGQQQPLEEEKKISPGDKSQQ